MLLFVSIIFVFVSDYVLPTTTNYLCLWILLSKKGKKESKILKEKCGHCGSALGISKTNWSKTWFGDFSLAFTFLLYYIVYFMCFSFQNHFWF